MKPEDDDFYQKLKELALHMQREPLKVEIDLLIQGKKLISRTKDEALFAQRKILKIHEKDLLSEVILDLSKGCTLLRNYRWLIRMHQNFYRIEKQILDEPIAEGSVYCIELVKPLSPIARLKSGVDEELTQEDVNLMAYKLAFFLSQCLV